MRKVFLLVTFVFSVSIYGQQPPSNPYLQTEVVNVDSISVQTLYSRTKLFIAENFKSAKTVIQLDDPETKTLVVKGGVTPYIKNAFAGRTYGISMFTLKIQCKDNKYKYTLSDIYHEKVSTDEYSGGSFENDKPACGTAFLNNKAWHKIKDNSIEKINNLIALMKVQVSSKNIKKDDF
ncbi:MAG TPA: DUF4468 domain-containing protein [Chitinophagaceae bacterium]